MAARETVRIEGEQLGDFEGNLAIQLRVSRFVDFAHAAGTERTLNLIGAETSSGRKGHARLRLNAEAPILVCNAWPGKPNRANAPKCTGPRVAGPLMDEGPA